MKVKEFLNLLKETDFVCFANGFDGGINKQDQKFDLQSFGWCGFGCSYANSFVFNIIQKDGLSKMVSFNSLNQIDNLTLELNIIKINKLHLSANLRTPNNYFNNSSSLEMTVSSE
jgi:hypothetical protein